MTTRKNEIDEEMQSNQPPEEVAAQEIAAEAEQGPVKVKLQTAEQFIQQAQEPQLAAIIDSMIDSAQVTTGADDRKMLRATMLVLRSIATSMPWDEEEGLDARRFHMDSRTALPSWRACIGALLQLEFSKPDDVEVDAEIEDSQKEEIQAEEEAEAAKAEDADDVSEE